MKANFCTLFNSNYLSRGLVMYDSLLKTCDNFHLYVFAFDNDCHQFLSSQCYEHLTVISLKQFEDPALLEVKAQRTAAEYCWTCTPSSILYCLNTFNLESCTYIDADLFFYNDPRILIQEMGDKSVLITEHRYTKVYDQVEQSGKYCVQFMTFKATEAGMQVLRWWRDRCLEWCFARTEDGKFGDQKYLDDWTQRFEGVHVLANLGGGVAPWNVQQYEFSQNSKNITAIEKSTGKQFDVIFFHFHEVKFYENNIVSYSPYACSKSVFKIFYNHYTKLLIETKAKVFSVDSTFDSNGTLGKSPFLPMNIITALKFFLAFLLYGRDFKKRMSEYHFYKI